MLSQRSVMYRSFLLGAIFLVSICCALMACSVAQVKGGSPAWPRSSLPSPKSLQYLQTFGGTGSGPGQFLNPRGISVDPAGNIYVADTGNHRVQKFDAAGHFITETGGFGWDQDRFNGPTGLTAKEGLNIYVVDSQNRRVQRFDRDLNYLSTIPASEEDRELLALGFLLDVELASTGELFVSDTENQQVLKLTSFGALERAIGGFGLAAEQLNDPAGLTVAPGNAVYVADPGNDRVVRYDTYGGFSGELGQGSLENPGGLEVDTGGYLFVADTGHDRVCIFSAPGELLFSLGASGEGRGSFRAPTDLALSGDDRLYVLDSGNDRVQIFQIERRAELGD